MITFTADKLKQARAAGYSDDEIWGFAAQQDDRFNKAKEAGYSLDEVSGFLSQREQEQPAVIPVARPTLEVPPAPEPLKIEAPKPQEGMLRKAADIPIGILAGTAGTLKSVADVFGADSPASQQFADRERFWNNLISESGKEKQKRAAEIQQAAQDKGVWEQAKAAAQAFAEAPTLMLATGAGSLAPVIVAGAAAPALGGGAAAVTGAQVGLGTLMGAGAVKGGIYEQVKQNALDAGKTPEEAEKLASEAQSYGENPEQIIAGGALGALASATGIEATAGRAISGAARKLATGAQIIGKNIAEEVLTEAPQQFQQRVAQNIAAQKAGFNVPTFQGAIGEATTAGIIAAGLGGMAGGIDAVAASSENAQKVKLAVNTQSAAQQTSEITPLTSSAVIDQAEAVGRQAAADLQTEADQKITETPDQRVTRLKAEAQAAKEITLEEQPPVSGLPPVAELPPVQEGFVRLYHGGAGTEAGEFTPSLQQALGFAQQSKGSIFYVDVPQDSEFLRRSEYDEQGNISDRGILVSRQILPDDVASSAKRAISGFEVEPATQTPEAVPTPEIAQAPQTRITEREGQAVTPAETPTGNRVEAAAYQAPDGTVYYGASHLDAMAKARDAGKINQAAIDAKQETTSRETPEFGFATNAEPFVSRDQAETIARESGQITVEQPATGKLHSNEVSLDAFAKPVTPEAAPAAVKPTQVTPVNLQKLSDEALEREESLVQQAIKEEQNTAKLMEAVARLREISSEKGRRSAALLPPEIVAGQEFKSFDYEQDYKDSFKRPIFAVKLDDGTVIASGSWRMHADAVGEEAYALPVELQNKISESGFISDGKWKTKTFEGGRRGGTLEGFYKLAPLRRVARAEQTEEDVAGLVDAGFAEVYKGQPVLTQAGLDALPEAERPRLTPEARKIQIDTGANDVAAEAISKNLRIGVDQIDPNVRMPAGWTLVDDIYVPPTKMDKIAGFDVLEDYEVEQTADVFQSLYGKRPPVDTDKILADARAKRSGKPEELSSRPLRPRDYLNITVREALRKAATFNFLKGTRSEKFADIAAILAESPIPALSDEEIVSLGSKGRRGREARWIGGDIGMASTKGMAIETFIHEVGHTLTSDQIAKYEPSRRRGKPVNGKPYIDGLRAATQDDKVPEPVRRIFSLYLSTLDQFGVMDVYAANRGLAGTPHPDTSQRRAQKMQKDGKLRGDLTWNDLYALANVHEFVAQTFSSKSFQDKLKTLKSPINTNKTLWQEFISAIRQIFGFPSDSMAAAVVEASVDIAMVEPAKRMAAFIDNQNYLESFEDARELKKYLEANNTNNLGDAKDDFRKRFNREPNAMAGQHAKYFPMLDIEAEIKKYQERVDRYRQMLPSQRAIPSPQPQAITPTPTPEVREARREPAITPQRFYSQLQRTVEAKMPNVSSPEQLKAIIDPTRGSGVKPEEVKWSGITEAIDRIAAENNGRVPKEAVLKYLRDEGAVKFEEVRFQNVVDGEDAGVSVDTTNWKVGDPTETRNGREWTIRGRISEDSDLYEWKILADTKEEAVGIAKSEAEELLKNLLVRSEDGKPTLYDKWQLAGGENYREVVLTMPSKPLSKNEAGKLHYRTFMQKGGDPSWESLSKEVQDDIISNLPSAAFKDPNSYTSDQHFQEVQNYVAHMRLNDRKDADGRDGLFIEEIQSDRHQEGREKGYDTGERNRRLFEAAKEFYYKIWIPHQRGELPSPEANKAFDDLSSRTGFTKAEIQDEGAARKDFTSAYIETGVPDAPFRKDWPLQMFKRALEEAVTSGKEWIGWTVGETQADRYDLSKQISKVLLVDTEGGNQFLYAYGLDGNEVIRRDVRGENIAGIIGKDAAEKLANAPQKKQPNGAVERSLEGIDLKVGTSGMEGFYDNILPKEIAKYVKKWGATVEKATIETGPQRSFLPIQYENTWVLYDRNAQQYVADIDKNTLSRRPEDAQLFTKGVAENIARSFSGSEKSPIWRVNITPEMRRIIQEEGQAVFLRRLRGEPMVGMETAAVEARLQELGFPTGGIIRVVNQPDADFEGRTIIVDGKVTGIELNAAALKDNAAIDRVLNHEFAESANADGALNKLVERLTPKEKKEINDTITRLRYEERARTTEEAARAIETLAEAWKGRGFFTRAVARIEAWANKLGFKLTRRAAEYIAARNLADINSGFKAAYNRFINVKGEAREGRAFVTPEENARFLELAKDPEANREELQKMVDDAAKRGPFGVASWHGSPTGRQIKKDKSFDPAKLGATTGAGSAKEAFFFAKNIGTSAEYAIFDAAEAPFGDWFWQPKNLNDLLGHMRDLVFGATVSGNKVTPDASLMPDSLWQSYGEAVKKMLDAKTPEERRKAYIDFRSPSKNARAYEDVVESVSERANIEAIKAVYEEESRRLPEEYYSLKKQADEKMAELKELARPSISKWAEQSFRDIPSDVGAKEGITELDRFKKLLEKNPEDALLKDVVERKLEIQKIEDRIFDITEERDSRVIKKWDDLSYEEQQKFIDKYDAEIQGYESDAISGSQELAIFKDLDEQSLPLSVFEWGRGKEGEQASVDRYYLKMENPLVKRFEGYRDEKFIEIINKAKAEGYDSVIFENVRDGGGFDTIYAVFTPEQIKSADPVTYDDKGNVIPLEQRFQPTTPDIRYARREVRESRREPEAIPTFTEGTPESATLKEMEASMAKVDAASEAKGGKPETYKISEIASVWMDSGLGERELQDAIVEYTNLTPANAQKVAKAINKQYGLQKQIAEAVLETEAGVTVEELPEGMEIPKEVDPKNKRTVLQRVIDATTGVRVKPVVLQVPEKTALKEQIRMKARETREAKKAQQETADAVVEAIKALELRGPMRPKQAQALAKRAAKVIWTSEKSMENFIAYAERVMANTNYDADLREAKAAQKRAKELSKRDSIAAPQRFVLEAIGNIGINLLNDPREFADVVNHYLRSFKPVVSEAYVVVPDSEMESYLSMAEDEVNESKAEFDVEDNERLAEKYGVSVNDLQRFLDAEDIMDALASYAKREAIEGILNEKSSGVKEALKGVDTTTLRADQRKLIDAMKVIDIKSLDSAEKQAYIRIGNNIIFNNNQTNGAEFFVATAKGQQSARDLAKNTAAMTKNKAWANILPSLGSRKAKKLLKSWASELQSIADTFRNAFGKEAMTVFYEAMGMVDLDLGFTQAARTLEEIQEKMAKFYDKLDKKYKGAARTQDGILSEGIVGYLIQNVPAKGESESLAQRRNLMQQNVANLRKSGDEDKIQMADRIQQLMQRLDGDTVDQMLANLKREYPANYESLMWLKDDLFPQYKDFLKFSDENFNDQANNYNTPNYLPIIYSNASPALDLLQGKKKYYDNLSSAPKQSSYTIKRSDYTQLPMGSDGRTPKEIGLNLRKNAYNSLSDQITRAYTNPARQRIYSFLKTPEAEEALGGKANLDFFADRIERLMGSRERRGSINEGFFGKAVDVIANLVRDIGTRIALAGSYQLIRQPADQVTVAVGATGRADLMAEHLAPRSIQNARPVLDLFSIGRRGDASSGYKYINQMEGAQSRLERYYTEGNWVKAKEAAKRFADKFMAPLKVSDFTVAAATWMTFYRAYLAKNGIKFTTWEDAANLIKSGDAGHKRAAAHAENMTDIYQGSSDPTKMAVFAQKGKTGTENLLKSILVPFNSFGIQFRARVSSDLTEIFTKSGDWKGKAIAVKDLSATIGGTVMFGLAKRFVLPAITYGGIKILYAIFGVDVEEPDEEKQKEEFDQKWRQLQGDIISTMVVGGFGQMIEGHTIDGMNYIKYMIDTANESESVLDDDGEIMSFNEYSKERAPFYRYRSFDNAPSLGMLDIGMDQAGKAVLNTKMVLTPEEMERFTPEEQRFLYVALLSDWLYLAGFNDADFARMWDKGRRDMIKARKEEEKELQRIRSGR